MLLCIDIRQILVSEMQIEPSTNTWFKKNIYFKTENNF